jgi:hypothetical protein
MMKMTGGWTLETGKKRYTTYRCENPDCQFFRRNKFKKPLFKGVIGSDHCGCWAKSVCDSCRTSLLVNVIKTEVDKKAVDEIEPEAQNYFKDLLKRFEKKA